MFPQPASALSLFEGAFLGGHWPHELFVPPFWSWTALMFGLVVGSFANVCIHRLPLGESVVTPPSRCPRCAGAIRAADNVPVLSYLLLRGRCRRCHVRISPRYPTVEAANGLLYMAVAASMGPTPRALVTMAFVTALLILALIDLDHQILPNVITLPGIGVGILASFLPHSPVSPLEALATSIGGYLALLVLATLARWYYGEEALGQGDWKMVAMIGAFLGWQQTLLSVFLAALLGSVVGVAIIAFRRGSGRTKVPFGTFLAAGALLSVFVSSRLLGWYGGLLAVA